MKLFVARYHRKYGDDLCPFFQDKEPSERTVIRRINKEGESWGWNFRRDRENIEVYGPWEVP
jgi:hypothetical protein